MDVPVKAGFFVNFMASLSADPLFHIGPVTVTNTMTDMVLVDILIFSLAFFIYKHHKLVPGFLQAIIEMGVETFYNMTESVAGERTKKIFPFVMTFFLVVLLANWTGLFPFITAVGVWHGEEFIPFIRSASTDLNFTFSLAVISLVATHGLSIKTIGIKDYLSKFIPLHPLKLPIGLLELILEFAKIISFSFRLFGNIFVGKIMLLSATSAFAFFLPIPVLFYEFFIGIVQAAIFALLTMAFMSIMTVSHNAESH